MKARLRRYLPVIITATAGLGAAYLRFRGQPGLAAVIETHAVELLLASLALGGAAAWQPGRTHEDIRREAGGES